MAINVAATALDVPVTFGTAGLWFDSGDALIPVTVTLGHAFYVHSPPAARNTALDSYYNAQARDSAGVAGRGVVKLVVSFCPSGSWDAFDAGEDTVIPVIITVTKDAGFTGAVFNDGDDTVMAVTVDLGATDTREGPIITLLDPKRNWVKWSDIGHLDFTIWKDNVAGERPMDLDGSNRVAGSSQSLSLPMSGFMRSSYSAMVGASSTRSTSWKQKYSIPNLSMISKPASILSLAR